MAIKRRDDLSWVRGMFGGIPLNSNRRKISTRQDTVSTFKFADTTLGGNQAINAPYQFTRFADLKSEGFLAVKSLRDPKMSTSFWESDTSAGSYCMGRVYSETIDDNAQYLHLRFGVPKYTGTIAFFANMYDVNAAKLAKTGNYSNFLRGVGKVVGLTAMFAAVPMHVFFPILAVSWLLGAVLDMKPSKYYYLKPTPNLYWQAVQSILDTQLLHHRLVPMWDVIGSSQRYTDVTEEKNKLNSTMRQVYTLLPDIWKSNGKFDVYKMINRYTILAGYQQRVLNDIYANSSEKDFHARLRGYLQQAKHQDEMKNAVSDKELNLEALARKYEQNAFYQTTDEEEAADSATWQKINDKFNSEHGATADQVTKEQSQYAQAKSKEQVTAEANAKANQDNKSFWSSFIGDMAEQYVSELYDGDQFLTFKVDAKETISDSLTNSTREPEISASMNGISSKARSFDFSTSNGNTGFDFVDTLVSGVKDVIGGTLDAVHMSGLAAFFGASIVDIPDVWDSSEASIGTVSYTIPLRCPFGNDLSLFQDIMVPLSCIIAAATPLATGKQTHTAPFLVEAYSRGRQITRLGIIDSVSINRGVGNMGWRADGRMLGCDVTISIKDLSRYLTMPIIKDPGWFDDANKYTDYMATLGAAGINELVYNSSKVILNVNKWKQSWKSFFMTGRITNSLSSVGLSRAASTFTSGTLLQ